MFNDEKIATITQANIKDDVNSEEQKCLDEIEHANRMETEMVNMIDWFEDLSNHNQHEFLSRLRGLAMQRAQL